MENLANSKVLFILKPNVNYMYLYKYKEGGTMHGHRKNSEKH